MYNKLDLDGGKDEMDSFFLWLDGDKFRVKLFCCWRNWFYLYDEDIIDGFVILSFKFLEDLVSFVWLYDLFIWFYWFVDFLYVNLNFYIYFFLVWIFCFVFWCFDLWFELIDDWRMKM